MPDTTDSAPSQMLLADFAEHFRTDLVYAAPETWPGRIAAFLDDLIARYGATGSCGEQAPALSALATIPAFCDLPVGHDGMHRAMLGLVDDPRPTGRRRP